MDVRIGVIYTAKELVLEMDGSADEIADRIRQGVESGDSLLWLTDKRGHRIAVPIEKLAYVEIEGDDAKQHVGFGR